MYVTKKIYYDKITGEVILDNSFQYAVEVDFEQDYTNSKILQTRTKESLELKVLENNQYNQDFLEANYYRVNPISKELEFSYPDPNTPEAEPVYVKPLTEQVDKLKERQDAIENALLDLLLGGM